MTSEAVPLLPPLAGEGWEGGKPHREALAPSPTLPGVLRTQGRERAKPAPAGFTLIELVITVAIVGILALGLLPLTQLASQRAKEQELRAALRELRTAIDAYKQAADENRIEKKADQSGYPPNLAVLVEGVQDIKTPEGKIIYFLRRLPRDPLAEDDSLPAAKTWGLRSYESPPDDPREGDDVFDVYSLSRRTGLNGVPYREW